MSCVYTIPCRFHLQDNLQQRLARTTVYREARQMFVTLLIILHFFSDNLRNIYTHNTTLLDMHALFLQRQFVLSMQNCTRKNQANKEMQNNTLIYFRLQVVKDIGLHRIMEAIS